MANSGSKPPVRRMLRLQPLQDLGSIRLDGKSLVTLLARIDDHLASPGVICLIGSGATILLGQTARQTDDIDVWEPASRTALPDLRRASEAAGLTFDPKEEFPPLPYLQVVHPGIVQVPGWNPKTRQWLGEAERQVWKGRKLTVTVPPPVVIVASKLVRGDQRDLEDCLWLMAAHSAAADDVTRAVKALVGEAREKALDSLDLLRLMRR